MLEDELEDDLVKKKDACYFKAVCNLNKHKFKSCDFFSVSQLDALSRHH